MDTIQTNQLPLQILFFTRAGFSHGVINYQKGRQLAIDLF